MSSMIDNFKDMLENGCVTDPFEDAIERLLKERDKETAKKAWNERLLRHHRYGRDEKMQQRVHLRRAARTTKR